MGIFDRMKKSMGFSDSNKSKGHVLGGGGRGVGQEASPRDNESIVTFTESNLGLTFTSCEKEIYVSSISPSSEAARKGISPGDQIISIDGNEVTSIDAFHSIVEALPRPIRIKFTHPFGTGSPQRVNAASSTNSTKKKNEPMTQEAKDERRMAMAQAAKAREQSWDRRVASSRGKGGPSPRSGGTEVVSEEINTDPLNPETQKMIEIAKQREDHLVEKMGYNPFQPHMSFSSRAGGAGSSTPVPEATGTAALHTNRNEKDRTANPPPMDVAEPSDEDVGAVDLALAKLLSISTPPSSSEPSTADVNEQRVNTAVSTALKMLTNLNKNRAELKFRSIRLNNASFQGKVGSVAGGVELFLAAGFVYSTGTSSSTVLPSTPAADTTNGSLSISVPPALPAFTTDDVNVYLIHDMTPASIDKLQYTISRLAEIAQ